MTSELQTKLNEVGQGYTIVNGIIKNPEKFEGETLATLYYYDAYLNGDGVVMEVTPEERKALELPENCKFVYLNESDNGFISLDYCENEKQAEELDEMNSFDEYSGLTEEDFS